MEHAEARLLLSARMDGELTPERAPDLDAHLETCDACRAFAAGAERLRALTLELPRLTGGDVPRIEPARARRFGVRIVPALAAVVLVAVLLTIFGPPGSFSPPIARAAERLTAIRTMFVDRTITDATGTTREKIWFRAPAFLRIERTTPAGTTLEIDRPGERYTRGPGSELLETGLPPRADIIPEPLSPTIELLGDPLGPGPVIDGIPTTRYQLTFDQHLVRTAYVASNYLVLGAEESLVLQKTATGKGPTTTKRVTEIEINKQVKDSLFAVPSLPSLDSGFRHAPLSAFSVRPAAVPAGFTLVASGTSPQGDVALFARGALPIEVDVSDHEAVVGPTSRVVSVSAGTVPATIIEDLYALPRITFTVETKHVTIVAPLDQEGLISVARTMFALPE